MVMCSVHGPRRLALFHLLAIFAFLVLIIAFLANGHGIYELS